MLCRDTLAESVDSQATVEKHLRAYEMIVDPHA
jgi:hypothetical protein